MCQVVGYISTLVGVLGGVLGSQDAKEKKVITNCHASSMVCGRFFKFFKNVPVTVKASEEVGTVGSNFYGEFSL